MQPPSPTQSTPACAYSSETHIIAVLPSLSRSFTCMPVASRVRAKAVSVCLKILPSIYSKEWAEGSCNAHTESRRNLVCARLQNLHYTVGRYQQELARVSGTRSTSLTHIIALTCNGLICSRFGNETSAPLAIRNSSTFAWPACAAQAAGVLPRLSRTLNTLCTPLGASR